MKPFSIKEYETNKYFVTTRNMSKVRILCTDRIAMQNIVALVIDKEDNIESIYAYFNDGKTNWDKTDSPKDLMLIDKF